MKKIMIGIVIAIAMAVLGITAIYGALCDIAEQGEW